MFIATDDKSVIEEARKEWGPKGFHVYANDESAEGKKLKLNKFIKIIQGKILKKLF